jgi:hypothetical protein
MIEHPKLETLPSILNDSHLLLVQVRRFVTQCIAVLDAGEQPDVMGLDDQVKILCGHIAQMSVEEAAKMRPKMDSLIDELDQLSQALSKERALVKEQLNDLTRQQQAMAAYQRVNGSVPLPEVKG